MECEFDPDKSVANRVKHGIDVSEAQRLWDDPHRIEVPVKTTDEARFLAIGKLGGEHWSGVITYRSGRVRILSVRRSRAEEVAIYEG